jgi:hypothetical protein
MRTSRMAAVPKTFQAVRVGITVAGRGRLRDAAKLDNDDPLGKPRLVRRQWL